MTTSDGLNMSKILHHDMQGQQDFHDADAMLFIDYLNQMIMV